MANLGIQFTSQSISLAYYEKDKLVGETLEVTPSVKNLKKILDKANIPKKKKFKTIFSLPEEFINVTTLKSIVNTKKLKNGEKIYFKELEKILNKSMDEYIFDTVENGINKNSKIDIAIVDVLKEDFYKFYNKIIYFNNLIPAAVDIDAEALRRLMPKDEKNMIIIQFYHSKKRNVGIYVYKGDFIISARHIILDLYTYEEIKNEIERTVAYAKSKYREYAAESYYAFGLDEELDKLKEVINFKEHSFSRNPLAVAVGLSKKEGV